jgi:16S rRNA (cytidine1402-2'-O)-methyltransferase
VDAALYVVATPLGNLRDITLRGLDVLKAVDVIAAEDTRVTRQLLSHYDIHAQLLSVHEHNEAAAADRIVELLAAGKAVAYVTDAGTPAISDPGALLVRRVREVGRAVIPIPGASALTAALSAAGIDATQFLFYGFLPHKPNARREALEQLRDLPYPIVFFEAPHRLSQALADLAQTFGAEREVTIARELTKLFETFHRCRLADAPGWVSEDANRSKGELVMIVDGARRRADEEHVEAERVLGILLGSLPLSQAVALAAQITGGKKNALYERALQLRNSE